MSASTIARQAIDIANLRARTGFVTLDPAYVNTASTTSAITFLDGEKGVDGVALLRQ